MLKTVSDMLFTLFWSSGSPNEHFEKLADLVWSTVCEIGHDNKHHLTTQTVLCEASYCLASL